MVEQEIDLKDRLNRLAHELAAPLCALEVVLSQAPHLSAGAHDLLCDAVGRLRAVLAAALTPTKLGPNSPYPADIDAPR